jgi:hypothetical protein
VADDHDRISTTREGGSDVVGGRSRCQSIVGLGLDVERSGQLAARLTSAEQGAREDRLGRGQLVPHALTELASLLPPLRGQPPELVGLSRGGLGVADEVQAHCG